MVVDKAAASNPLLKRLVTISGPRSPNQIPFVIAKRYHNLRYIADGSYGVVVSAVDALASYIPPSPDPSSVTASTFPSSAVAIKRCHKSFAFLNDAKHLLREVRLLAALDHPNILHIRDIDLPASYSSWTDVYLVTPLMPHSLNTRLSHFAASFPATPLPDPVIKTVLTGLARALLYMQSASVVHRDLKTANVLTDENWSPVLCDLGLARAIDYDSEVTLTTGVVTRSYRAPELFITPTAYTDKLDMWSVGCILAELIRPGVPLFRKGKHATELAAVLDVIGTPTEAEMESAFPDRASRAYLKWQFRGHGGGVRVGSKPRAPLRAKFLGVHVDWRIFDILEGLLELDPGKRMSPEQLLASDFLASDRDVRAEKVVSAERKKEVLDMEPPPKCTKDYVKRALWAEAASYHPEEAEMMERTGAGPPKEKSAVGPRRANPKSWFFGGFKSSTLETVSL